MERVGGEDEGRRAPIGQVAFASFVGTAIEWYDYSRGFINRYRFPDDLVVPKQPAK